MTPPDHPFVAAVEAAVRRVTGREPERFVDWAGATDARLFRALDIPTVVFGAAGSGFHGANEHARVDSLVTVARVYLAVAADLLGRVPERKYLTIPEDQARVAALERGEVDIAVKLPTHDIARIKGSPNLEVQVFPSIYTISFEVNVLKKPFSDKRVRQALMHAIDRAAITRGILQGFAQPAVSPVGPGIPSRRTFDPWPYDPKKARALLTEAGYPNGFSMAVWSPHGRYLKDAEVSEAVVSYLKDVGIDASLKIWEWSPYVDAVQAKPSPTKAMDVAMLGRATMGADFWMYRLWHSKSGGNITGYSNPRVDQLLEAGRTTFDRAEADRIYGEVQEILFKEDVPFIFLHHQSQVLGVRKGLTGLYAYPEEFLDLFGVRKA
jgi:ABC-type transport system substrate-binding protein